MQSEISGVNSSIGQLMRESEFANSSFGKLHNRQLNWNPSPGAWSIGQCLEHLIVTNKSYFNVFESIVTDQYKPGLWCRISPFSRSIGKSMIMQLGPVVKKKFKSPMPWKVNKKEVSSKIVEAFIESNKQTLQYFKKLLQCQPEKLIISSPANGLITYSLADAMRIIINHERRHLLQAERVMKHVNFPVI